MKFLFFLLPLVVFGGRYCPQGSFDIPQNNECLHTEVSAQPFSVANLICGYLGGNLIKITNAFLNNLVAGQALSLLNGQKGYIGVVKANQNNWTFIDGTQLSYANWMQGQPSDEKGSCVAIDPISLQWTTTDCQTALPYFCTIPDLSTPCPNGWTYLFDTDSCYYVKQTSDPMVLYMTDTAEAACVKMGGHLVSIHSQKENDFVKRIIQTDNANPNQCGQYESAIGLQCKSATFSWTDGSEVSYRENATLCSSQNYVYGIINDPACNATQYQHWDEWQYNQAFSRYTCKMPAH